MDVSFLSQNTRKQACDKTFKLQKATQQFPLWLHGPLQHPAMVPSTTATRYITAISANIISY